MVHYVMCEIMFKDQLNSDGSTLVRAMKFKLPPQNETGVATQRSRVGFRLFSFSEYNDNTKFNSSKHSPQEIIVLAP